MPSIESVKMLNDHLTNTNVDLDKDQPLESVASKIDDHSPLLKTEQNVDEGLSRSPTTISHYHKRYKISEKISIGIQTEEQSTKTEGEPSKF